MLIKDIQSIYGGKIENNNDIYKIIDLYFKQRNIMFTHLIYSYDKLIGTDIFNFLRNEDLHYFYEAQDDSQHKIYRYKMRYSDIAIKPPHNEKTRELISPSDARLKNLTYEILIECSITQVQEVEDINTGEIVTKEIGQTERNYPLISIPCMRGSQYDSCTINRELELKECRFDPQGYFIISGQEKALMSLERLVDNRPLVFIKKESNITLHTVQINSRSFKTDIRQIINIMLKKDMTLTIKVPILHEVPVIILLRALGIESDKDIMNCIVYDQNDTDMLNLVRAIIENSKTETGQKIYTQENALIYLSNKIRITKKYKYNETDLEIRNLERRTHLTSLFKNALLPHMEDYSSENKALYFCYMINRLLQCYLKRIDTDDRDSFENKRIDLPGQLLFDVLKQNYKKMLSELTKIFKKRDKDQFHANPPVIINQLKVNMIKQGFKSALSKGVIDNKDGVSQMLPRMSYLQTIAALRRINSPTAKASTNKLTGPRHLHPSQLGFLCYVETPEGHNIGLIKNFSLIGTATIMVPDEIDNLTNILRDRIISLSDISYNKIGSYVKVFLNGVWSGFTDQPTILVEDLKAMKRNGTIDKYTSIVFEIRSEIEYSVRINCDSGRLTRPILRVDNDNKLYLTDDHYKQMDSIKSFNDLLQKFPDIIEFIDADEQANSLIANFPKELTENKQRSETALSANNNINGIIINRYDENLFVKYTHCELHPSLNLGCVVTNIPFCNHNQGPRNIYQYSHAKQAMGIYATNWLDRMDSSYILYHTSRPIVTSRNIKYVNTDQIPAGDNAIVAICCYTGFNQEDSVIMSQSSIERGFMNSCNLKKYGSEIRKNQETSKDDIFKKPDPAQVSGLKYGNYEKLNEKGFVPEETQVVTNDILIGKISSVQQAEPTDKKYRDNSEMYKQLVPAVVHRVIPNIYSGDDYEMIKGVLRSERIPHIGDKFCLTPEHEVLTEGGWVSIANVTLEHKVAILNPNNNTFSYENPLDIITLDYEGSLYNIDSVYVPITLTVTPDHNMYVKKCNDTKYNWYTAQSLFGDIVQYKNTAISMAPGLSNYMGYDINQWLIIFTTIITYGRNPNAVSDNNEGKSKSIKISVNKNLIYITDSMAHFLRELDIDYEYTDNNIYITEPLLVEYFNNYDFDRLPDFVFNLSKDQSLLLIKLLLSSQLITPEDDTYITQSKNVIDDFQRLAINAGLLCVITQDGTYWKGTLSRQIDPHVGINKEREYYTNYKGLVHCLEVSTHIFMVRKNGKVVWTGNCSRHGQKGTLGNTYRQSDMPFTKEGMTPDIIMNPNAIPSRMTMGQVIESLVGKVAAIKGFEVDGTPFQEWDLEKVKDILENLGYNREGKEYLYSGMTGKRIETEIFIGPTYYQRLKHMVSDKIHSRSTGANTILTRQPPEGRARDGGLRFGEMERDCIITQGLAQLLKERLFDTADAFYTHVCDHCGFFAQRIKTKTSKTYITDNDLFMCPNCKNKTDISLIGIPYACKILFQELTAMNIAVKIKPDLTR